MMVSLLFVNQVNARKVSFIIVKCRFKKAFSYMILSGLRSQKKSCFRVVKSTRKNRYSILSKPLPLIPKILNYSTKCSSHTYLKMTVDTTVSTSADHKLAELNFRLSKNSLNQNQQKSKHVKVASVQSDKNCITNYLTKSLGKQL